MLYVGGVMPVNETLALTRLGRLRLRLTASAAFWLATSMPPAIISSRFTFVEAAAPWPVLSPSASPTRMVFVELKLPVMTLSRVVREAAAVGLFAFRRLIAALKRSETLTELARTW